MDTNTKTCQNIIVLLAFFCQVEKNVQNIFASIFTARKMISYISFNVQSNKKKEFYHYSVFNSVLHDVGARS